MRLLQELKGVRYTLDQTVYYGYQQYIRTPGSPLFGQPTMVSMPQHQQRGAPVQGAGGAHGSIEVMTRKVRALCSMSVCHIYPPIGVKSLRPTISKSETFLLTTTFWGLARIVFLFAGTGHFCFGAFRSPAIFRRVCRPPFRFRGSVERVARGIIHSSDRPHAQGLHEGKGGGLCFIRCFNSNMCLLPHTTPGFRLPHSVGLFWHSLCSST